MDGRQPIQQPEYADVDNHGDNHGDDGDVSEERAAAFVARALSEWPCMSAFLRASRHWSL
jgi:hypothetical protein